VRWLTLGSYTQFHSLAYIVKLNIELCMADLISKVVRRQDRTDKPHSSSNPSKGTDLTSKTRTNNATIHGPTFALTSINAGTTKARESKLDAERRDDGDCASDTSSESGINFVVPENSIGVVKTIAVESVTEDGERREDRGSTSSSTAELRQNMVQSYPHRS
jgi:hypothetical protein